ncbi:MAG: hypothetical protein ACI8P0_005000 [Planctomycetaceae bacterium]|jgi:hypothetical protein
MNRCQQNVRTILTIVATTTIFMGSLHGNALGQVQSDSAARQAVFGDEFIGENASVVRRRAALLEPIERYLVLSDFVLSAEAGGSLRLPVVLTPLNSALTVDTSDNAEHSRVQTGGQIESPLLDLVDVARQLNRLGELRSRFEAAPNVRPKDQIARLAGLAIVSLAADEAELAGRQLAWLYEIVAANREWQEESEGALLLAIQAGAGHAETRAVAGDLAYNLHETHLDLVKHSDWRPFHRHVAMLANQIADAFSEDREGATAQPASPQNKPDDEFSQWRFGSLFTAKSRGMGCPPNVWSRDGASVRKTSGHNIDLLFFQSPLQGNFNVECDASVFSWRSIHPTYGGHWAGVEPKRTQRRIGTLAELESNLLPLDAQLTKFRHEIHYRISVHGQQMEVFGNGRLLNSIELPKDHEPWLALRRSAKHSARVWNVRITGQPEIPAELRLSESPNLEGWIPYFGDSTADVNERSSHWRRAGNDSTGQLIAGRKDARLPSGSDDERLLYYHRPMLEDGTVEYRFFYKAGQSTAHPAIGRAAFLLKPDGVNLHWVTDGTFDRSELSPGNSTLELENRRGPAVLPLKDDDWNAIRLTLVGDTVSLFLNDVHIYERRLEAGNQRNFGVFHYADRSQAVFRNVVWRGDWPKELPTVYEQELAGDDTRELDQSSEKLAATFRHSFTTKEFPFGRFVMSSGKMSDTRPGPEGLYVKRQGSGRYQRTVLAAQLAVGGDFDISASFDSLVTKPDAGGHSSCGIQVKLADKATTETNYRRRHNRFVGREDQHLAYGDVASYPGGEVRRSNIGYKPAESNSGTLRVARRGNRLYTLFAEGDSANFRITGQSEFPTDDVLPSGILLTGLTFQESFVSFRWKELVVRADRVTGPAVDAIAPVELLADLRKKRDKLSVVGDFDFTKKAPTNEEFYRWGSVLPWSSKLGGQMMIHQGQPTWAASGITPRGAIDGDFDITAVFELKKIVSPTAGDRSTIYLQTVFGPTGNTHASLMFDINAKDARQVFARLGTRKPNGGHNYSIVGSVPAADIAILRVARYGTKMYFLTQRDTDSPELLVAASEVSDETVSGRAANFIVHSGGEGRETQVLLKSLKIRAEKFTTANNPIRLGANPDPAPRSKSFFDSVIDFFK